MTIKIENRIPNSLIQRLRYLQNPEEHADIWDTSTWDRRAYADINFRDYFAKLAISQIKEIKANAFEHLRRHPELFQTGACDSKTIMDSLRDLQWVLHAGYEDLLIHFSEKDLIPAPGHLARMVDWLIERVKSCEVRFETWLEEIQRIKAIYIAWVESDKYESHRRDYAGSYFRNTIRVTNEWALREALIDRR